MVQGTRTSFAGQVVPGSKSESLKSESESCTQSVLSGVEIERKGKGITTKTYHAVVIRIESPTSYAVDAATVLVNSYLY